MSSPRLPVLLSILAVCVLSRVPSFRASFDPELGWYLWNFSPLWAIGLFSAAMYRHWLWALVAPLAVYLLGDLAVWISSGDVADAFHAVSVWSYLGVAAVLACGWWLRRGRRTWPRVALASVGGAAAFFLVSNFGSWAMDPLLPTPTGYDRSLIGLWQSYVAAIPFVRNDFASTLLFSALFFSPAGIALLTRDEAPAAEASREKTVALAAQVRS